MSKADEIIARGDPAEIVRMALGARNAAAEGRYCQCAEPALTGYDLMCGDCLLENQDQVERATRRINDPHEFEPFAEDDEPHHLHRELGMCSVCSRQQYDQRHEIKL